MVKKPLVIGIKPDIAGAMGLLWWDQSISVEDLPTITTLSESGAERPKVLSIRTFSGWMENLKVRNDIFAFLEKDDPLETQNQFAAGMTRGSLLAIFDNLRIPASYVASHDWRCKYNLLDASPYKVVETAKQMFFDMSENLTSETNEYYRAISLLVAACGKDTLNI